MENLHNYTAIYSTRYIHNIHYSFKALNDNSAIIFALTTFHPENGLMNITRDDDCAPGKGTIIYK